MDTHDDLSYYGKLLKMVALLKDGHTYITIPDEIKPPYSVPIGTTFIEGKHVLSTLPKDCGIPLYSEIISVDGILLEEYLEEKVYPYIWHEKIDSKFKFGFLGYMISCLQDNKPFTIETNNGSFEITKNQEVETIDGDIFPDFIKANELKPIFRSESHSIFLTNDNIGYINIPTFKSGKRLKEELYNNIHLIKDCKGFIIDVRGNDGGGSHGASAAAQLFIKGKFKGTIAKIPYTLANLTAYGDYLDIDNLDLSIDWHKKVYDNYKHSLFEIQNHDIYISDCPINFNQPLVILSDCSSASAAEEFLSYFKGSGRGTIVGTNSYGSSGETLIRKFPFGGSYAICTMQTLLPDGTEYINIGIQPDIYIDNTLEDFKNNFDRIFSTGLNLVRDMCNDISIKERVYYE